MGEAADIQAVMPVLRKAAEQFNARRFWECHETLEPLWLTASEPMKTFLQGLIQTAAGFVHVKHGNYKGATRLLTAGLHKLQQVAHLREVQSCMNVKEFIAMVALAQGEVARLGPEAISVFPPEYFPCMKTERPSEKC